MKKIAILICLSAAIIFMTNAPIRADEKEKKDPEKKPLIQIALLLDTSNSMDGLIGQAKAQLWKVVNQLAMAEQNGKKADLYIALYEYGNNGLNAKEGWIRCVLALTTDLDMVSEKLFALKTNGGTELCGAVIDAAADALDWSKSNNDLKAIYIAGNEPFTQGNVNYQNACKKAIEKGVIVNTIFCGNNEEGIRTKWQDGAALADGQYMNIDHNRTVAHVDAPQDKKINETGKKLNDTYVPYGDAGKDGKARQEKQDSNAGSISTGNGAQRHRSKAQEQYRNDRWDLVDAVKNGKVKLEDVKDEDLPKEMRKMTLEEKKAYIEKKYKEREEAKEKINRLSEERDKFVAEKRKEEAEAGEKDTLGKNMRESLKRAAEKKDFKMK
jgi:hypothetical protein